MKQTVLFLCTGNSCRSQMAEGWGRALKSHKFDFYSAGIERHGQNPNALKVMQEVEIDISEQQSQTIEDLPIQEFDYVITVCGHANEHCPYFPANTKLMHVGFDDPPKLAADAKNEQEALVHYRKVRDEIRNFVANIEDSLNISMH